MLNKLQKLLSLENEQISRKRKFCLGLGAQRCGSTWLGKYLENHPEYCMSNLKEMHVFDSIAFEKKNLERNFKKSLNQRKETGLNNVLTSAIEDRVKINFGKLSYYQYFDKRINDAHVSFGEITPEYALLPADYLKYIYNSHPNVRIFMLMRNPIKRYISALQYWGRKRPSFSISKNYIKGLTQQTFDKYTRYDKTILRLQEIIPRERLYFEYYENLFQKSYTCLYSLCSFLGISYIPPEKLSSKLTKSVNASPYKEEFKPSNHEINLIYQHFSDVYHNVPRLISKKLPVSWQDDINLYGN